MDCHKKIFLCARFVAASCSTGGQILNPITCEPPVGS